MISEIMNQNLKVGQKMLPERIVSVSCETISVHQDEPRPAGIAVPAQTHDGTVIHDRVMHIKRLRELKSHQRGTRSTCFETGLRPSSA